MKRILITLTFSFAFISLFAQMPNKGSGGNNNDKQDGTDDAAQDMGFSVVKGTLRDAVTKEPIEFAAVSLIRTRDSAAQCGTITGSNGKFRFEKLPVGNYIALVSFIGYKKYRGEQFVIKNSSYKIDLGTINIQPTNTKLNEVEVVASQNTFEMHADKKVFNVDKNITTVGGTATDVLKNVPSVTVDQDGNVSLRGKTVTILIDNKPSTLGSDLPTVLQQIPANAIENIEIITNPSAKYSAEGVAGIINIVLKKNKLQGYNGVLIGGLGTNSPVNKINNYNATGTYNFKTEKFNVSTVYSFRNNQRYNWGVNSTDTVGRKLYRQTDSSLNSSVMNYGKASVDYYIDAFNTIGANLSLFRLNNPVNTKSNSFGYDATSENTEHIITHRDLQSQGENYLQSVAPGLTYRHIFTVPKHTLDVDVTVSDFKRYSNSFATDYYYIVPGIPSSNEITSSTAQLRMYNAQVDYSNPIKEGYTLDAGYKFNSFDLNYASNIYDRAIGATDYIKDTRRSSTTKTITSENDVYTSFSGKYKRIDYQAGLRGEYAQKNISINKANAAGDSINFTKTYPDLFPSAFLTYNMTDNRSMGLNYSRRVERPQFMQIIPVTDYSVPKQPRRGNPDLQPEYTHSMEYNFSKTWTKTSLNLTFYDYYTTNAVTYFRQQLGKDTTLTTYVNTKTSNDYGIEMVMKNTLYRWWDITTSVNAFQEQLNGDNLGLGTKSSYQANAHVVSAFRPNWRWSKNTSMQLTALYQSKQTLIQGSIDPILTFDFGLRKEWGKAKQYTLSLSMNDIFNQRRYVIYSQNGAYSLLNDRRFDSRTITVSFMYRYGKFDASSLKKKKTQDTNPNMMGGDSGF